MATSEHYPDQTLPVINDILASGVLITIYLIRFAALDSQFSVPWFLLVTTDVLIPLLAATWIWVGAMYALQQRV